MMIRSTYTLVLTIVATLAAARSAAYAAPKPKIAVLGLEIQSATVDAADAEVAKSFTTELRARARQASGPFQLAPGGERELIDEKVMNGCNTEAVACMSTIGKAIPTDQLMYGKIERGSGESYKITIRLLNLSGSSPATNTWGPFPITEKAAKTNALKEMADKAYDTLVGVSSDGTLTVKSTIEGAKVFVNDEEKGEIRGGALLVTLPENRYHVAIEAKGYQRWESPDTVTIHGGQNEAVTATLVSLDMSHEHGGVVSGENKHTGAKVVAAVGFGVAAVAGGALIFEYTKIRKYNDDTSGSPATGAYLVGAEGTVPRGLGDKDCAFANDSNLKGGTLMGTQVVNEGDQVKHFNDACSARSHQTIEAIVGVGGLVVGTTFLILALRGGDGDEQRPAGTASRKHRKKAGFAITPIVTTQGGGATVRFDW